MPRARSISGSSQSSSAAPVDKLLQRVRRYLHLPDPGIMYVLLGAAAANMLEGYPVWLMLVGPPGDGKSELLNSLLGVPRVYAMASISNETAFLSATGAKDRAKDATGGVLKQVGAHGGVVLNDFTSVLSLDYKTLKVILSVFRECFGGSWTRHVGVDGGRQINWIGRVAFFAGCTGVIDRSHDVSAALGERWVYYRMKQDEAVTYEKSRRALDNAAEGAEWREELRDLVAGFFAGLQLAFGESGDSQRRKLTDLETSKIIQLASIAARCRSVVVRDEYSKDILGVRETESGTRMATVLGQLLIGMEAIGVGEQDRWRLLGKVGMDSMPMVRRVIVEEALRAGKGGAGLNEVAAKMGASVHAVARAVEDLEVHGVVVRELREHRAWILPTERGEEMRKWLS